MKLHCSNCADQFEWFDLIIEELDGKNFQCNQKEEEEMKAFGVMHRRKAGWHSALLFSIFFLFWLVPKTLDSVSHDMCVTCNPFCVNQSTFLKKKFFFFHNVNTLKQQSDDNNNGQNKCNDASNNDKDDNDNDNNN